jgi:hypothetical protein
MSFNHTRALAGVKIPHPNCSINAAGDRGACAWAHANGQYRIGMAFKNAKALAGSNVPQAQSLISAARQRQPGVGTDVETMDTITVAPEVVTWIY